MFDTSKVGQSFPPFTVEVERCKIHELALAVGDLNPIYHNRKAAQQAGHKDVPLFPTAPTMFGFWGNTKFGSQLASTKVIRLEVDLGDELTRMRRIVHSH